MTTDHATIFLSDLCRFAFWVQVNRKKSLLLYLLFLVVPSSASPLLYTMTYAKQVSSNGSHVCPKLGPLTGAVASTNSTPRVVYVVFYSVVVVLLVTFGRKHLLSFY